ncbi:MAG: DUF1492 domain-containing protein [Clostridiales bacterium]|nr:DUF1492 domain-containing protein [Clostridiales bacterium]
MFVQALWLDKIVSAKLKQLEVARALAEKVTVDISKEKISGGDIIVCHMENAAAKLMELSAELDDCIDKLVDTKREILETIEQVENINYRLLLEMRYVNGESWDSVADTIGCDVRNVFRIHGKALKEIEKIKKCQ